MKYFLLNIVYRTSTYSSKIKYFKPVFQTYFLSLSHALFYRKR